MILRTLGKWLCVHRMWYDVRLVQWCVCVRGVFDRVGEYLGLKV